MVQVVPLPAHGDVFVDTRGEGRALRVSWHHEDGFLRLSLWRGNACVGTFQLAADDVPDLVASLVEGLAEGYAGPVPHRAGA